ncbi:MAG: transglycosylase SLT domain-containing protein [Gammaproteobacteria bacterium]|nr:transglycosylase SLT domain-containing protein [Gammaproteobacteria bacterium]
MSNSIISETPADLEKKAHPWRRCPLGKHLVREHSVNIPPSKKHPNGIISIRHEHCAANKSHKDELSYDEIQNITHTYFPFLQGSPTSKILINEYSKSDNYDMEIRGWTKYWNEVFQPDEPLDPNLIKALILTESSFEIDPKPKLNKDAHGLMQILTKTLHYLSDTKGELKNYLVCLTKEQLLNPSANICAGTRWLFRKRETATNKLKHKATWVETIEDYKSFLDQKLENKPYNHEPMDRINHYYHLLRENNNNNENKNPASHIMLEPF